MFYSKSPVPQVLANYERPKFHTILQELRQVFVSVESSIRSLPLPVLH